MVVGWLKPAILMPVGVLTGLSSAQVEAILIHELAHIRRLDYLVNLLQTVVEILFFYHPAVWWISKCMTIEREFCCDDFASKRSRDTATYVGALAVLEERRDANPVLAVAATGGSLLRRIARLCGKRVSSGVAFRPGIVLLSAFAASMVFVVTSSGMGDSDDETVIPAARQLTSDAGHELSATWSPPSLLQGSQWIAFDANHGGNWDIWKKPLDGGPAIRLTRHQSRDKAPKWSPDGSRIAFSSNREAGGHIWTMSSSGDDLKRVTGPHNSAMFNSGHGISLSWSPDSKSIAYTCVEGPRSHSQIIEHRTDICVVPAEGGETTRVTSGPSTDYQPAWSPDGTQIAFTSTRPKISVLCSERRLTKSAGCPRAQ